MRAARRAAIEAARSAQRWGVVLGTLGRQVRAVQRWGWRVGACDTRGASARKRVWLPIPS